MIDRAYLKKYGSKSGLQTTRNITTVNAGRTDKTQMVRPDPLSLVSSFFIFQFGRLKGEKKLKYAEATSAEVYLDIDNILLGHIRPETLILDYRRTNEVQG